LLYGVNNNFIDFGNRHVLHIFSGQVKDDPEAVAITCNGRSLSYGEIDQLSDNLAGYFVARIAAAENKTICLLLERNENIIISILAIWKAGATYVPLGHDWPDERIGFILEQTNAQLLVSDELHYQKCVRIAGPSGIDCCCLNSELINVPAGGGLTGTTGEMAYILYTSGSSGEPKGVMVNHHSLANILCSLQLSPGINRNDKFLSVSSYTFDISLVEFFLPLTCGAQVILALTAEIQDTKRLSALIGFHAPTIMQATPGLWHTLIETGGWKGTANMKAITCGEPLTRLLGRKLLELTGELWNFYGPTETTIFSTGGQIVDLEGPPGIGLPVANTEVYVLDKWNRLVAAGVWGELHIGGKGLAMGYLKDKTRTRQKFRSNPYRDQHIVYATGDIVRWMANGTLEFKGRSDEQIKVRGYRIEPGEIEHYISRFPGISSVTVTGIPDETGNKYLVAYIISAEEPDTAALQHYLKQYLPLYMIPAHYIRLQSLPLTGSGKIDRKRLMDIKNTAIITGNRQQIVPQNSREQIVLELWENILNRKGISTTDNFFDIGGHSLKANQLVNKILLNTGISISLADIFLHTTIQKQAALIDATEKQTYQHIEIL
jgi:amino acid adenylation domain-containing protein